MLNTDKIITWIKNYFIENGPDSPAVIGISGGKDSSVAATLLVRALGPENVIAVKMPQGIQHDIDYANDIIRWLNIPEDNVITVNIEDICASFYKALPDDCAIHKVVTSNLPARVRMTVLYAIAGAYHGRVANTCNYSEDYVGYSTKFGDNAGDFSLLSNYTVREVIDIGRKLGIPEKFLTKTPEDGLCGKTDEDNLGFTYETLDKYLMEGVAPEYNTYKKICQLHEYGKHKTKHMPTCPQFFDHR